MYDCLNIENIVDNMIAVGHWTKVTEAMPKETKYESNNLQGHHEWTESDRVLVITDHEESFVDSTKNGKFNHDGLKDCDGFPHWIVAWMPIPPFNNIEESKISDDLEEASWKYAPDLPSYNIGGGYLPPQSRNDLRTAFKDGAKWEKEQLMKEAVPFYEILKVVPPGSERDKVHIIIVKED